MWFFYVFALLPIAVGAFLWYCDKEVTWQEWLIGSCMALVTALTFQLIATFGMISDVETWSGQLVKAVHYPRWVETYQQAHTRTVGSGKDAHTETYYTTEYRTHSEHWEAESSIDTEHKISEGDFQEITGLFGGLITTEQPHKSGFYSGDRNIYVAYNAVGYIYPVTKLQRFENRVKASPTVFSFAKVPTNITVYAWPRNPDWRTSGRLLGTAIVCFDQLAFDQLNSRLGPRKKVNLIFVGFGSKDSTYGQWQEAKWVGGKKNDLVVTFGGGSKKAPATWVHAFGWTEKDIVKRELESALLQKPLNDSLLVDVEKIVLQHYVIKDWKKFDYIAVDPPAWAYWTYILIVLVTQGSLWVYLHVNEYSKSGSSILRHWTNRMPLRRFRQF